MLYANQTTFRGIFPRKGRLAARFEGRHGTRWVPVKDREVQLCTPIDGGQGRLYVEDLTPESQAKVPAWQGTWFYLEAYPKTVFQLAKGVRLETWTLSGSRYRTLPPGTRVLFGGGYPSQWLIW